MKKISLLFYLLLWCMGCASIPIQLKEYNVKVNKHENTPISLISVEYSKDNFKKNTIQGIGCGDLVADENLDDFYKSLIVKHLSIETSQERHHNTLSVIINDITYNAFKIDRVEAVLEATFILKTGLNECFIKTKKTTLYGNDFGVSAINEIGKVFSKNLEEFLDDDDFVSCLKGSARIIE